MTKYNNISFLISFNNAINKTFQEIKNDKNMNNPQFYSMIIDLMNIICKKNTYQSENENKQITVIQEDRMFETILDFFNSIDVELYNKANEILNNTYPNTKTYIYDFHKNDPNHLSFYSIFYGEKQAKVYLPLRYSINEETSMKIDKKYGEDFYTIDDLYSVTHEIAHLLDINPENFEKSPSKTRDILTEVTPGIFELYLSDYLLKNEIFDVNVINNKKSYNNNKLLTHANMCRIKLNFLELKRKKGEITEEDIKLMMKKDVLNQDEFIKIINLIVKSSVSITENKRYAFCLMYAPIIFQKSKNVSDHTPLKKYLNECSKNLPFTDILDDFGIHFKKEIDIYRNQDDYEK